MSKTENKKNVEKLKIFLAKLTKQNDIKTSDKKVGGNSNCTPPN